MNQFDLLKVLTIFIFGLILFWLIVANPSLPDYPKTEKKANSFSAFEYSIETPQTEIEEIENRPLFQPTRRPFIPSVGIPISVTNEPEAAPPLLDNVVLIGITIGPNGRAGLVKSVGESKSSTVREGETLNGWRVESIRKNFIYLSNGNDHRELHFPKIQDSQPANQ